MKQLKRAMTVALLAVCAACSPDPEAVSESGGADIILINARVYTLDWGEPGADGGFAADAPHDETGWHPDADAVVTKGGRILYVGNTRDALVYRGEASRVHLLRDSQSSRAGTPRGVCVPL